MKSIVTLLRPKHWVKNVFVLAPVIFAGKFTNTDALAHTLIAFAVFCLAASATYVLNDILDAPADRVHPTKCDTRPIAAGHLTERHGWWILATVLSLIALVSASYIQIIPVILGYLALNIAYSTYLKRQPVLDIFSIALGFVLRVYAGAVAIDVPVSNWMFITTFCAALFLASMKRLQELKTHGAVSRSVLNHYTPAFISRITETSGALAVVFYSLFTLTERPGLILTVPITIFALVRYWYVADKSGAGESPTDLIVKDKQLLTAGALLLAGVITVLVTA